MSKKSQTTKTTTRAKHPAGKKPSAQKRPPARKPSKIVEQFDRQGIFVQVSYEADWLGMSKHVSQFSTAHLEIKSIAPAKQPLPVTETGYRSHFIARGLIEEAGGPLAYVRAWLEQAAKAPAWKRQQEASRQLCLF